MSSYTSSIDFSHLKVHTHRLSFPSESLFVFFKTLTYYVTQQLATFACTMFLTSVCLDRTQLVPASLALLISHRRKTVIIVQ